MLPKLTVREGSLYDTPRLVANLLTYAYRLSTTLSTQRTRYHANNAYAKVGSVSLVTGTALAAAKRARNVERYDIFMSV